MFQLTKTFSFEASHCLEHHDGKCAKLHGHSYKFSVELSGDHLQDIGPQKNMLTDFHHISKPVKKLIESHLDHHHLNDSLMTDSPTAEFIAKWIFQQLHPALPILTAVTVQETASSSASYRPIPMRPSCLCCETHRIGNSRPKKSQKANDDDDDDDDPISEDTVDSL